MTREEAKAILEEVKELDDSIFQYNKAYMVALDMAINALSQEEQSEWERDHEILKAYADGQESMKPCKDAISRQAVLEKSFKIAGYDKNAYVVDVADIKTLPSVSTKNVGKWIYTDFHTWCCSECGGNPHKGTGFVPNKDGMKMRWKYCNLCGAKMGVAE